VVVLRNQINEGYKILMDFGKIADTYYPHFIVEHDDSQSKNARVKFSIDMRIIDGEVPVDITQDIISWAHAHYKVLEESWLELIELEISSKFHRRNNNLNAA